MHHGLLIVGQSGIGKREFGLALSKFLLCEKYTEIIEESAEQPCGNCQNCRLFDAGTHPDFHVLISEHESLEGRMPLLHKYSDRYQDVKERDKRSKPSRVISVEQVRSLIDRFSGHAHISKSRVGLILPAECMNINAANALLKLLEEPPPNSVLILVTPDPGQLPATIRSRCLVKTLPTPEKPDAICWIESNTQVQDSDIALTLANGGPLEVRNLSESGFLDQYENCLQGFAGIMLRNVNPVELAAQLNKLDFEQLLLWMQRFVTELIKLSTTTSPPYWGDSVRFNIKNLSVERLYGLYDRIGHYRRITREPVNEQLAIEDLVLAFQRVVVN